MPTLSMEMQLRISPVSTKSSPDHLSADDAIRETVGALGAVAPNNFRLTVLNCNRLWSYSGHLHDGFHGFAHFLASQS